MINSLSKTTWPLTLVLALTSACNPEDDTDTDMTLGPPITEPSGADNNDPTPEGASDALCERLDYCNELDGVSVGECSEWVQGCVDESFNQSQASDWAQDISACLELSSCGFFIDCYWEVPGC